MTDRGTPTPESVANRPRRRLFTLANGLFVAGAVMVGGVGADAVKLFIEDGLHPTPASSLVRDYENTTVTLGKAGELAQIPQRFDAQKVEDAYKEFDAETNRALLDSGVLASGMFLVAGVVIYKSAKRTS